MAKGTAIFVMILGLAISVGLLFVEWKMQAKVLSSSMKIQAKITKPPKHALYYVMKGFEWLLLGLTWGALFLTLYFEFNKLNSWKILTFCWLASDTSEVVRIWLKTAKPNYFSNTLAASGCECYFGVVSWYAAFTILFWCMFYKEVLADRDFLEDSHKLIVKIVLGLLIILGVFARFFFGLETYNQIFIGVGFALFFFGLSMLDEFWEQQFSQIFNSESSKCFARWFAFFCWMNFALDFGLSYWTSKNNVLKFERKQVHPFAKSACKTCFAASGKRVYLSYNSLSALAWFSFVPMMMFYYSITSSVKYSNSQLYMIKYLAQFKDVKALVIKVILLLLLASPLVASHFYTVKSMWWHDVLFKFGMSFLWCIIYRWINPVVKKSTEIDIEPDMFSPWMKGDDEEKTGLL
jgi:hypothetical protein